MTDENKLDDVATTNEEQSTESTSPKYTQAQLESIINRKVGKILKDQEAKLAEFEQMKAELDSIKSKSKDELPAEERWKKEANDLKKKLEQAQKERIDLENSYKQEKKTSKLQSKINELVAKATKPQLVAKLVADAIKIDDSESIYAEDGESIMSPEEYINKFFVANPEFLPAPIGGSGGARELKSTITNNKPTQTKKSGREIGEEIKRSVYNTLKSR